MEEQQSRRIRRYSELIQLQTFEERFQYLKLDGQVGFDTFGYDRFLYQDFLRSKEWRDFRWKIITRDKSCDLAMPDHEILTGIFIHHMNPVSVSDILKHSEDILNPEYVILVSRDTHNALHYGTEKTPRPIFVERVPNDTCPWKL